jgi:diguanylate cyclase
MTNKRDQLDPERGSPSPEQARPAPLSPWVWRVFVVAGLAWIGLYFLTGNAIVQQILYPVTGLMSFCAILSGIRRNGPAPKASWILLGLGLLLWVIGDVIWGSYELVLHRAAPFPSAADFIYLLGPFFMAWGLTRMLRERRAGGDVDGLIDAMIIAAGVGTLSWAFLVSPYASDVSLAILPKMVAMAYPLADILLLVVVTRLLLAPGRHGTSHRLLAGALSCTLLSDVVYSFQALQGGYYTGHAVDVGWLAFYVLMGAAALHPSMASAQTGSWRPKKSSRRRLLVLAAAASIAPLTLVIQTQRGAEVDVAVIAGASILVFSLVVFRMERLVHEVATKVTELGTQGRVLRSSLHERKDLEFRLRHQALHDPLTGLANRSLFRDRLSRALRDTKIEGDALGLLFVDIDDFKQVNDTMGHEAGDHLLLGVASRLEALLRTSDTAARLGGDEFAIVLDRMERPGDAAIVAERVRNAISLPFMLGGREVNVHASIGVACTSDPKMTSRELQSQADIAMYAAKHQGKNNHVVYEASLQEDATSTLHLRTDLKEALGRRQLRAVYQPIVDLVTGEPIGAEALVRWDHPIRGTISPAQFLPLAEQAGIIFDLDMWMLKEACSEVATWRGLGIARPLKVNVNVSAGTLQHAKFVETVSQTLTATGADPTDVVLELTETVLIRDVDVTIQRLTQLKALGIHIAIDDFGTGYSSLAYLKRFPIDIIKIDKSFVDGVALGPAESSFVATIIALADQLNLSTVAEGVEDAEQVDALIRMGAQAAQGFLFSRPVAADVVRALIVTGRSLPASVVPQPPALVA